MELKYADITEKIIGCAMKVHSKMGPGYPEIIYARCLAIEFNKISLRYEKEKNLNVYYDEHIVGGRRVDFMVEEKIVVELKALAAFNDKDFVQALNYLESHRQEIALLLNFGAKSLQFKRIINNKNIPVPASTVNLLKENDAEYNHDNSSKNPPHPWFNPSKYPENPWL
jgi:GxxExxY protein